ncbi:MAG: VOC family protein [Ignavibacteriaceae bacterium]|nr:VOC family protein [Ignavibacteriaceae bacterium]
MKKITPFLWFDNQTEDAINFYVSAFSSASGENNSKALTLRRYGEAGPGQKGTVITGSFLLYGEELMALNGGPIFKLSPSISFFVNCSAEDEINKLWEKLSEGGTSLMELDKYPFSKRYGWVQDKFGVSWQLNLAGRSQKIAPLLWFNDQAEKAMQYYTSIFSSLNAKNISDIISLERFVPGEGGPVGKVKHAVFSLNGQEFMAMDCNKEPFSLAISLFVNCETQKEVDELWEKLSAGGEKSQCGWLKDKFGVSWQIVPTVLGKLLGDPDPVKSQKVMKEMLKMNKLDIDALKRAYEN